MNNFTFLTKEQIWGEEQLDILKKYGIKCAITDFAILLGGYVSEKYYTSEGNSRKDRTGLWWTKTPNFNDAFYVNWDGNEQLENVIEHHYGARPAIYFSLIKDKCTNIRRREDGILEVEFGVYPQTVVSKNFAKTLEVAYSNSTVEETGKSYTTLSHRINGYEIERPMKIWTNFEYDERSHIEYEYNGRKYIRVVGDHSYHSLSDGSTMPGGEVYWIEVEPIKWLVDEKTDIALSKNILFSGVPLDREKSGYYRLGFNRSYIKDFMDRIFSKDIIPSTKKEATKEKRSCDVKKDDTNEINTTPLANLIDRILEDPDEFYEKIAEELTVEERLFILDELKNKSCLSCTNGCCSVPSYEKVGVDESGKPVGSECIGWFNARLIGRSKVLRKTNIYDLY